MLRRSFLTSSLLGSLPIRRIIRADMEDAGQFDQQINGAAALSVLHTADMLLCQLLRHLLSQCLKKSVFLPERKFAALIPAKPSLSRFADITAADRAGTNNFARLFNSMFYNPFVFF